MNKRRFFFYWAVILVLAAIVLVVLLVAASGSTQALDTFPVKILHGMLAPGFTLFIPLKEMNREGPFLRKDEI
jgi:hypothetical protein